MGSYMYGFHVAKRIDNKTLSVDRRRFSFEVADKIVSAKNCGKKKQKWFVVDQNYEVVNRVWEKPRKCQH